MSVYEERLSRDLSKIENEIANLGKMAREALRNAVTASLNGDTKLANETVINDKPINRKKKLINELSHAFLAVHQPTGTHLREVTSIMGIVDELERIGDYAVTIARNAIQLPKGSLKLAEDEVKALADTALHTVDDAVTAFFEHDEDLARKTLAVAKQAQGRSDDLFMELTQEPCDSKEKLRNIIDTLTIAHQLKRASDRAENICEAAVYAISGEAKKRKVLKVLFLDPNNDCQSQIAEAVARRAFPRSGEYTSGGKTAGEDLAPGLRDFMDSKGLGDGHISFDAVESDPEHAAAYDLVISLKGPVEDYFPGQQPYRTTFLEWDVGDLSENPDADGPDYNRMYQSIGDHIRGLIVTMRGKEAG